METVDRVTQILDHIPQAVLEKSRLGRAEGGALPLFWISANRIQACAQAIRSEAGFVYLENFSVMQVEDNLIFTYFSRNPETREMFLLRASVEVKPDEWIELESVSSVWPAAEPFEREIARLYGVKFSGKECESEWDGFPLRKSFLSTGMTEGISP